MTTLVYVGANVGVSLWGLFDKFDEVYVFEPDPEMFSDSVSYTHLTLPTICSV